jgi:predicted permease
LPALRTAGERATNHRQQVVMRDLRLAFRTLLKSPFVTAVAILSLALGIGANTAIYSMFEQLLLRPLPVNAPDRLVNLSAPGPKPGSTSCNMAGDCEQVFSYPMYRDLEREPGSPWAGLAGHRLFSANLAYQGSTVNGDGVYVSGSYFPLLGIGPARGRLLGPADDQTIGAHPVVVLSHSFWEGRLGSDPAMNSTIIVNGQAATIVGVAWRASGATLGPAGVFVPITMRQVLSPTFDAWENRRNYWVYAFGRLQPGATMAQAQSALNASYRRIVNDVEAPLQQEMSEQTMAAFRARQVVLADGRRGQSSLHEDAKLPLIMLFATAGMVLLIACANIANLLLARGASRDLEMAVRLSLGASRRRVLVQLLTESVVLALLGGVASLLLARWTLNGVVDMMPAEAADMIEVNLRPTLLIFAAALSIGTGLVFGMFPALHSTRSDLITTIRSSAANLTVTRAAARSIR